MTAGNVTKYRDGRLLSQRVWSGGDGKVDPRGGTKWNGYSMDGIRLNWVDSPYPNFIHVDGTVGVLSLLDANDQIELINKLAQEIKGHSFNAAVFLATGNQTLTLAKDALSRSYKALVAIKKGRLADAARVFGQGGTAKSNHLKKMSDKDVSSAWLELQYGWLPLLSDVHEAGEAWEHANQTTVPYEAKARKNREKYYENVVNTTDHGSTEHVVYKHGREMRARIFSSELSARSLGLTDPMSVAWELMPWSFVADWFIPIGSYLEALNNAPLFDGAEILIIDRKKADLVKTEWLNFWHGPDVGYVRGEAFAEGHATSLSRGIGSISVPLPGFKAFEKSLSLGHVKNAIALIHQLSSK